jgi:alpha-L-rhamnosidase
MGTNFAGWCQYHFPAPLPPAGTNLTLMHAERLVLDGGPDNGTITHAIQPLVIGAFERTQYLFGEAKAEGATFEPGGFVSYGFRYVQLFFNATLPAGPPKLSDIQCWAVHTDLQQTGRFAFAPATSSTTPRHPQAEAAQALLEDSVLANYNATILTAEANWISFPTDCPHRERRGWLGDAQAAAETLMWQYDMSAANSKWLEDVRDAAKVIFSNGDFPTLAPNYNTPPHPSNSSKGVVMWLHAYCRL